MAAKTSHPNQPPALRQTREAYQISLMRPSGLGVSFKQGEKSDSSKTIEAGEAAQSELRESAEEDAGSPGIAPIFSGKLLKRSESGPDSSPRHLRHCCAAVRVHASASRARTATPPSRRRWLNDFNERHVTVDNGGGVRPPTLRWTGGKARVISARARWDF
jgi:hypothetical protein